MLLQACLNGVGTKTDHPALPVTPGELAADAAKVRAAGAESVHIHVKDARGVDTLDSEHLSDAVAAVRETTPGLPIGVTTGAWSEPDPARRADAIASWTTLPDFASVNWHETGAEDVAVVLLDRGVDVEAGLWHPEAARAWLVSPLRDRCCRVLLELSDGLDERSANEEMDRLLPLLSTDRAAAIPVLLHGEGTSCWHAIRQAYARGLATRIGLEDVMELPDGSPAPDNAALVAAAAALLNGLR